MQCRHVKAGGVSAIVCGHFPRERCSTSGCRGRASLQCDYPVSNRSSGTCDRFICEGCAHRVRDGLDYCAAHQRLHERRLKASASCPFNVDEADEAGDEWRFNCGPAALCAILGLSPAELRPHMRDFESKGYTNPTLMWSVLTGVGVRYRKRTLSPQNATQDSEALFPRYGLARVQWGGPWTAEGVPMPARYRETHWVASSRETGELRVFDVNATCVGGWLPFVEWSTQLVPWLLRECAPKSDGSWWLTHVVNVVGPLTRRPAAG